MSAAAVTGVTPPVRSAFDPSRFNWASACITALPSREPGPASSASNAS
jgi:hypothetical protein